MDRRSVARRAGGVSLCAAVLAFVAPGQRVAASPAPYTAAFEHCSKPYRDDATLHGCLADEYGRQDRVLNGLYRALMARLPPPKAQSVRLDERTWIKATKTLCERRAAPERDGSDYPLIIDQCYIDATRERIGVLQTIKP